VVISEKLCFVFYISWNSVFSVMFLHFAFSNAVFSDVVCLLFSLLCSSVKYRLLFCCKTLYSLILLFQNLHFMFSSFAMSSDIWSLTRW